MAAYHEHGSEVAEVSEEFLHGGLLGVDGEILQHVEVKGHHITVHDHQLLVLIPSLRRETVRNHRQGQETSFGK